MVKKLILLNADINTKDEDGWIPLHAAAWNGYAEIAKLLLEHGADVNAKDKYGWTPLLYAAASPCDNKETISLLLACGANPNVVDREGRTPLREKAIWGHTDIVRLLLEHGADANAKNNKGETAYDAALSRGEKECCCLLKQYA